MHWTVLKLTFYNKCVAFAFDSNIVSVHVDTAVAAGVLHGQAADGDGVVHRGSGCYNPAVESFSQGDFAISSVIVKHLFHSLAILSIQIHPDRLMNTSGTSFRRTL